LQQRVKNPDPKDPALNCPLRGLPYSFPLAAVSWSDGVMEWWSNGVMKKPIHIKFGLSFLPTLQYSKSVRTCTGRAIVF
jgi:hypothetical protein